jgi:predicted RNA binding protein YcfA (HicA-like mRNA interferase family)
MSEIQQKLTSEEIKTEIENWKSTLKLPKAARGFFKGSNIDKLIDITNSSTLVELEMLSSSGELSEEEMIEYYTSLPEFQNTVKEINVLADEIFLFIKPRIPKAVQQVFRGPKGYQGYKLGPLVEIINSIAELCSCFLIRDKGFFIFHNLPATRIEIRLTTRIIIEMLKEMKKLEKIDQTSVLWDIRNGAARAFTMAVDQRFQQVFGVRCPGTDFLLQSSLIDAGLKKFSKSDRDLSEAMSKEKDLEVLKREATVKFELIQEQEPMIHTTAISKRFGSARLEIRGVYDHLDALSRSATFHQFRIILDPGNTQDYQIEQHKKTDPKFGKITSYEVREGHFDGIIERATGEVSLTGGIPYSLFLGEEKHLRLKALLYDLILEHLAERVKEISRQEKWETKEPSVGKISTETVTEVRKNLLPTYDWKQFIPPTARSETEEVPVTLEQLTEIDYKQRLRGLQGNRVLNTLKSMISLNRVSGSHHIFECRGGGTYPIAIHGSDQVGIGMLLTCLKHFGITPQEFFEKLS